ncbi:MULTISPECIES: hypothetical protein [unclassified Rhizobium]|uniref:hypothetical protein n=1 Tax=unclassified Rhizobium TaxID=2613769 RepID=UPI001ADB53E4|nr:MULTISPECIES: hypothetical protein [unclassified Rhizobium]MBO9125495.1 hypothetical protein [Rhizobium sp. 16-488-2b]MBO9176080.1 hypothetical protein [Rhizobium sp. 16-488-2a]
MSYSIKPRNDARKAFLDSGLTYADLSRRDLEALRSVLGKHLKSAETMKGYRIDRAIRVVDWPRGWAALTCSAYYFEKREAITFGQEGFIGFGGWADDSNVAPIISGFHEWLADTAKAKSFERSAMLEAGAA